MQKKQQQCHFCEAQASVWVSFVGASGGMISQPLCEAHAAAMGLLDPLGYSLLEPWGAAGAGAAGAGKAAAASGDIAPLASPLLPTAGLTPLPPASTHKGAQAQQELFSAEEMGDTTGMSEDVSAGAPIGSANDGAAGSANTGGDSAAAASPDSDGSPADTEGADAAFAAGAPLPEPSEMDELLDTAFSAMVEGISAATGGDFKSVTVSLHGMMPLDPADAGGLATRRTGTACPQCGFTIADWKKLGRLGCPQCYETFGSRIKGQLPHLHGGRAEHFGKIPAGRHFEASCELRMELWRRLMERAVKAEAYEEAAYARDRIEETRRELLLRGHMHGRV